MGDFLLLWSCSPLCQKYNTHRSSAFFYDEMVRQWHTALPAHCRRIIKTGPSAYGFHEPYRESYKGVVVTLFRRPVDRLISAFLFHEGMMLPRGSPWKVIGKSLKAVINTTRVPIFTYTGMPGVAGCQTKMVLGLQCGEVVALSDADTAMAVEIVSSSDHFAFIGLTEEPEASALLFLAMYGPRYESDQLEQPQGSANCTARALGRIYSTRYRKNSKNVQYVHDQLQEQLLSSGWVDHADDQVVNAAARVFYRRCREFNISTKHNLTQLE